MIVDPLLADSAMESAIKELRQHVEDEAFAAMSRAAKEVYESHGLELMDDPMIYRCIFETTAAHSEEVGHRLALRMFKEGKE